MLGCGGVFWVGVAVIATGLVIQRGCLYKHKKVKHRYRHYFNSDIASSDDALGAFFVNANAAQAASDCNYLWALLGDGLPCAIAYCQNGITVIPASLSDGRIVAREGKRIELGVLPPNAISMVWLVRKDDVSPVYEVHIQYADGASKSEIRLYRFELDVAASLNYHKFRQFVEAIKTICRMHGIAMHDFIRR